MDDNSAKLKVLGDIEHIRLRPGMYIGNTFSPDHLGQEVVDNSLDELANGFATTITIDTPTPDSIAITDDGRGIPIHEVSFDGKTMDSVIAACTKLFSGAKFDNNAYSFAIGLHGVGLVAVNALATSMSVTIRDRQYRGKFHHYDFVDSQLVKHEVIEQAVDSVSWNTRVFFQVNHAHFTVNNFDVNKIFERMALVSSKLPLSNIIINNQTVPKGTMEQYARFQLGLDDTIPIFKLSNNGDSIVTTEVLFTYDPMGVATPLIKGDVNLHLCGGTYLTNFQTLLSKEIMSKYKATRTEALSHLRAYVSVVVPEANFDSQSKANMTKNMTGEFQKYKPNIEKLFRSGYLKECIETIIQRKTMKKVSRQVVKRKTVNAQFGFKDCLNSPGDTIYIMEGASADGSLGQIRNKQNEAILPISGKILNVVNNNIQDAINSKKFKYLLEVLGVQLNNKNQKDFRYKRVRILCDADPDGLHIAVLVTLGLWYYASPLILDRRVGIILPPLYGATKGKHFVPIYDQTTLNHYKSQGYRSTRFKGIGEMDPSQLEVVIREQCVEHIVEPPATNEEQEQIISCISNSSLKKRLCEDPRFSLETLMNNISKN